MKDTPKSNNPYNKKEGKEYIDSETGFDLLGKECMDGLMVSYKAFLKMERQHPDEMRYFVDAIHIIQNILALRIVRRVYPKGWPIR